MRKDWRLGYLRPWRTNSLLIRPCIISQGSSANENTYRKKHLSTYTSKALNEWTRAVSKICTVLMPMRMDFSTSSTSPWTPSRRNIFLTPYQDIRIFLLSLTSTRDCIWYLFFQIWLTSRKLSNSKSHSNSNYPQKYYIKRPTILS